MIEFQNVTKLYGSVIGVNDITLTLEAGAYGLLGPNGSGKTTFINLILGQLQPTIGHVRVFGSSPWKNDATLRRIGICPAVDVLYSNVSAYDWVRYLVQLYGFSRDESANRAAESLEIVGMGEAMRRNMGTYSLGMRQRTKLAQAFAHDPDLLILDEPFNGLDPIGRHDMTNVLHEWARRGKSVLLASHVLHEVEAISPSFMLICGGRLLASGSPDEVHSLLADVPNEIHIRCDTPKELAQRLIGAASITSIQVDDGELVVATESPLSVYQHLPHAIDGTGIRIHEMRSTDESLQALFNSLMQIHRGEL